MANTAVLFVFDAEEAATKYLKVFFVEVSMETLETLLFSLGVSSLTVGAALLVALKETVPPTQPPVIPE